VVPAASHRYALHKFEWGRREKKGYEPCSPEEARHQKQCNVASSFTVIGASTEVTIQ